MLQNKRFKTKPSLGEEGFLALLEMTQVRLSWITMEMVVVSLLRRNRLTPTLHK